MKLDSELKADVAAELLWDPAIDATNIGVAVRGGVVDAKRSDTEIAQAAVHALRWYSLVPNDRIKVEAEDGRVTLTGEVDWAYQQASAEQCVRPLVGVVGVHNLITIKPHADVEGIASQITAALSRHAQREAKHIQVDVDGVIDKLQVDAWHRDTAIA
jgi:osmotically-inducible protein OsmY